jgi:hypothetical protein
VQLRSVAIQVSCGIFRRIRVQTIVLTLSRVYNSNLSAALTMQSSKVNRTSPARVLVSLVYSPPLLVCCYISATSRPAS